MLQVPIEVPKGYKLVPIPDAAAKSGGSALSIAEGRSCSDFGVPTLEARVMMRNDVKVQTVTLDATQVEYQRRCAMKVQRTSAHWKSIGPQ